VGYKPALGDSVKRFGTIDTFVETSQVSLKMGRLVANFEFLRALLTYGTFDEYRIFCPSQESRQILEQHLAESAAPEIEQRVVLAHQMDLLESLKKDEYSAFHLSDWHYYLPKMARLRARNAMHSFPLTGPTHSLDGQGTLENIGHLLRAPLEPWDTVICTSQEGRKVFNKMMATVRDVDELPESHREPRLEVIPLGVPIQAFATDKAQDRAKGRDLLRLSEDAVCYLYLGRISIVSKADLGPLLYAFRILAEHQQGDVPVRLVIAGSGGQGDWMNLLKVIQSLGLEGLVELRGSVDDPEKALLLAAADVFVSPVDSTQETFGISVVEAMAAGLPVIASDFDGYKDLVLEGRTGFLIPTYWTAPPEPLRELAAILEYRITALALGQSLAVDMEILLERMVALVRNSALRAEMGSEGRRRARELFTWDRIIPRYESLWAELKAQAEASPMVPLQTRPKASAASHMFDCFRGYPTHVIQTEDRLKLSFIAPAILEGVLPMPDVYEELGIVAPFGHLRSMLEALTASTLGWGEVREQLSRSLDVPEDRLDFLALWMLKRGLLKL
jgi:glycosyltransferase involved in cell wall biosynthesis